MSGQTVSIEIDGKSYAAPAGATLMETARAHKLGIAGLCTSDRLKPYGSCRLCMVRVEGQRTLAAACTTPVRGGMVVQTATPEIRGIRKTLLELYLADCPEDAEVHELGRLAEEYGADVARFRRAGHRSPAKTPVDDTSPFFSFDASRCILCARCARACDEIQVQGVLHLQGRGPETTLQPGPGSFADSACITCGGCVIECPTGALTDKSMAGAGGAGGAGAADSSIRTTCAYCGVGCQFDVQVKDNRIIQMLPAAGSPVNAGHACVKGRYAFAYVHAPDRLRHPLIRNSLSEEFREATWEEAIALIATRFRAALKSAGPDAVACISSARGSNEDNYLMQKFARACLGNNHIDHCARVCHSSTVAGMTEVFGSGAATNSLADIDDAKLLLLVGCNPTEAHPVTGARIKRAARRGAKLIVIDPRKIELTRHADLHLQLKPGSNVALLNGLAHVIIAEGLADSSFIQDRTENFEAFRALVARYTPEHVANITGVAPDLIRQAARLYAGSSASMSLHGLGVTEHRAGSYGVMALSNLAILTGNVGRPGTGINPLRGQNNVQGSCDMGALPYSLTAGQRLDEEQVARRFQAEYCRPLPKTPGMKIPEMYEAALAGKLKAMWIIGYDPAQTDPNSHVVAQALAALDFLVVSDLFQTETSKFAHVILPAAAALEKDGTFTNGERRVQRVRKAVEPPGEARSDWQAIADVSTAMGYFMAYANPSQIMDEIARLTPSLAGVSYSRLQEDGLQWPVPAADHPGTRIMHAERFPRGARGLARFAPVEYLPPGEEPDADYPLILVTGRILQHYNAGTMTRRTPLAGVVDRDLLELHPDDAAAAHLADGDTASITSRRGTIQLTVSVNPAIAPGNAFTTFHFPADQVNTLISSSSDLLTRCPEYKVQAVRVEAAHAG